MGFSLLDGHSELSILPLLASKAGRSSVFATWDSFCRRASVANASTILFMVAATSSRLHLAHIQLPGIQMHSMGSFESYRTSPLRIYDDSHNNNNNCTDMI